MSAFLESCYKKHAMKAVMERNLVLTFLRVRLVLSREVLLPMVEFFVHFVTFEAGAPAAIVPALVHANQFDPDEAEAPEGTEFINSQLFMLVQDNDVLWSTHNNSMRESTIGGIVRSFFDQFLDDEDAGRFVFSAQLDAEQLETAFQDGIEEIDLGLGGFRSALEEVFDPHAGVPHTAFGRLANWFKEERGADDDEAASLVQA